MKIKLFTALNASVSVFCHDRLWGGVVPLPDENGILKLKIDASQFLFLNAQEEIELDDQGFALVTQYSSLGKVIRRARACFHLRIEEGNSREDELERAEYFRLHFVRLAAQSQSV